MVDTIILRFRDFIEDTIKAHTALLDKPGFVWWGWWKKEDEPAHRDTLEQMREKLKAGAVSIGLFDRSTRRYYVADLADCLFAVGTPMSTPDREATPKYYRDSKVAAWFRLTSIRSVDAMTFSERFQGIPVGDGTLFPVPLDSVTLRSPQRSGDSARRLRGSKILHLSDLHFGLDFGYPSKRDGDKHPILEMFRRGLKQDKEEIGMIIVSGDLTTKGNTDDLQGPALKFLNALISDLKLDREFVAIVPGNHDYKLDDWRPQNYEHQRPFSNFLTLFYGHSAPQVPSLQRYRSPNGRELHLLMMDSVKLRSEELSNYGYIEWEAYEDLLDAVECEDDILRMAVVHHHLVPAPREEWVDPGYPKAGVSMTLDSGAVVEGLQNHRFKLVLHGHQHVPGIAKIARGRMCDSTSELVGLDSELFVIAGGSAGAGAARLPDAMRDNCFNILRLGPDGVHVECQRFTASASPRRWFSATILEET